MAKVLTENQKLLARYLTAVGCEKWATVSMVTDLWDEDAVLEMLEYCASNPDASPAQLLVMSSRISSRMRAAE